MAKEFADFMDGLREEPLEERVNELSDILTKVMTIVVSAIDDLSQKIGNLTYQFNTLRSSQDGLMREIQALKARPVGANGGPNAPIVTPIGAAPQAPTVQAAPKPAPRPLSPMSARSAINNELKALFSRRKKS
ncbi:MAG: hypothetical protein ACTSO9_01815 [Candidatus Helarchaeota archaeon]